MLHKVDSSNLQNKDSGMLIQWKVGVVWTIGTLIPTPSPPKESLYHSQ